MDEAKLLGLWNKGVTYFKVLSEELGRKPRVHGHETETVGSCGVKAQIRHTTTTASTDEDLLTHKQALRILAVIAL